MSRQGRPIAQGNRVIACHIPASRPRANLLDFSGWGPRPQKPYTSSEDAKLRALAKAGHSRNEIAAAMHRSSSSIYKRAKVLGIRLAVELPALHVTLRKLREPTIARVTVGSGTSADPSAFYWIFTSYWRGQRPRLSPAASSRSIRMDD